MPLCLDAGNGQQNFPVRGCLAAHPHEADAHHVDGRRRERCGYKGRGRLAQGCAGGQGVKTEAANRHPHPGQCAGTQEITSRRGVRGGVGPFGVVSHRKRNAAGLAPTADAAMRMAQAFAGNVVGPFPGSGERYFAPDAQPAQTPADIDRLLSVSIAVPNEPAGPFAASYRKFEADAVATTTPAGIRYNRSLPLGLQSWQPPGGSVLIDDKHDGAAPG